MKRVANLLGLWLWIGFTGGALVLLGLATPIEAFLKDRGMSRGDVDIVLAGVALAWVAGSFFAAYFLEQRLRTTSVRLAAHAAGAVLSAVVFMFFLQAGAGIFGKPPVGDEELDKRFRFGKYPDAAYCRELKSAGFTGVISLLNPVIPFEAVLLDRERESAREVGLELVELRMLPWVSENQEALEKLRALVKSGEGRYYVHCYLGRHRADLAKYTILQALGGDRSAAAPKIHLPERFERGEVKRIGDRILLGPLPTDEEWFEYVVRSGTRHVVSLLDPADRGDAQWIEKERSGLSDLGIELHVLPAKTDAQADSAAAFIRRLEGGVYLHAYSNHAERPDERLQRMESRLP